MKNILRRILPLLLALLLTSTALAGPDTIQAIGKLLLDAQAGYDEAAAVFTDLSGLVADLENQYAKDEDDPDIQDALINAMVAQEEAYYALVEAEQLLANAEAEHLALLLVADECETLRLTHDGRYADLTIDVTVDADLVIWNLEVVVDGDERDQAAGENAFLYQFIGLDLPVTLGNGKKDDVRPAEGAATTSEDLVNTLNSLLYQADNEDKDEKSGYKAPEGPITAPQDIADYLFMYGELPDNFLTKNEAKALGWNSSYNYVGDVAPGMSIGGDRFGNYEGLLPEKKGRTWYEADCYYEGKKRNAYRILYSSDGLVYYTDDHYETFTQMFPSWE